MIAIERKFMNIKIKTFYLANEDIQKGDVQAQLIGYTHSFIPKSSLRSFETIQIDLLKDESELLMEMHKTTRRQIRGALERGFTHVVIENPTDQELLDFQVFYNRFARNKRTHTFNSYHMQTMKLLREQNALMLTYMQDKDKNILCYRIYMTDGIVALNLYSASHFRIVDNQELKRILSQANRLLIWKSILWYKDKGQMLYDMGGLTDDENIRRFKLGFGGKIALAYTGYESQSMIGKIILRVRDLKLKLLKGIV
ncbi:hypothetical protein [Sporosarcina sp. Marseille-Q4943]|uniref:hypothetical protein n=1 Tax=Sporosarcina sp. Marseille-Q4943 TaxID=2942204 RepID=UPI00208DD06A|nr:hypothetical protein [Sporosarcina sp. Marseille-Q4943]